MESKLVDTLIVSFSPTGLPSLSERYADQILDLPLVDLLALSQRRYFPLAKVLPLIPYVCFKFLAFCFSSLDGLSCDEEEDEDTLDKPIEVFTPELKVPPFASADSEETPPLKKLDPIPLFLVPSKYFDPFAVVTISPCLIEFRFSSILLVVRVSPSAILLLGWPETTPINSPRNEMNQSFISGALPALGAAFPLLKLPQFAGPPKDMEGVLLAGFGFSAVADADDAFLAALPKFLPIAGAFFGFPSLYLLPLAVTTVEPCFIKSTFFCCSGDVVTISPSKMFGFGWFDTRPVASPLLLMTQLSRVGMA
mmetsp:Transcript_15130/g.22871  ORF Transcript_15130/g.22871 Transcript_15130/m.22871 type:complete len:309 (-) Transcript_15130:387-1313(-)